MNITNKTFTYNDHQETTTSEAEAEAIKSDVDSNPIEVNMSPGEKLIYKKMLEMSIEMKLMRKIIVDSRIPAMTSNIKMKTTSNKQSKQQLQELGLPLSAKTQLDTFEAKLNDDDFRQKSVSTSYGIFSVSFCSSCEHQLTIEKYACKQFDSSGHCRLRISLGFLRTVHLFTTQFLLVSQ